MSDFIFYKESKDSFGHVVYYCKCTKCGIDVAYGKLMDVEPICDSCKAKINYRKWLKKEKTKPLMELINAVKGYQAIYDKMPSMKVFDELVESVMGEI